MRDRQTEREGEREREREREGGKIGGDFIADEDESAPAFPPFSGETKRA